MSASSEWHSLLFVPACSERFVHSASKRSANAVVLDLEDSVPPSNKNTARQRLGEWVSLLRQQDQQILVRINAELLAVADDLQAAVIDGVEALVISKTNSATHVQMLDQAVTELEQQRGLPQGKIQLIAMIESIDALNQREAIAQSSPRLMALALGTEDLSLDGGFEPTEDNLFFPAQQLAITANQYALRAYGFPASIADYSDLERFAKIQKRAKSMGFAGAFCIHPSQVTVVNETYQWDTIAADDAREIITRYEQALSQQAGAVAYKGKMIDLPVVERARKLLESMG